jgi:hypothetical protein
VVNRAYTKESVIPRCRAQHGLPSRVLEATATVLSFGTNKLVARGASWLKRNGLTKYVVPALLANEAFGAYRAYLAMGMSGWW